MHVYFPWLPVFLNILWDSGLNVFFLNKINFVVKLSII